MIVLWHAWGRRSSGFLRACFSHIFSPFKGPPHLPTSRSLPRIESFVDGFYSGAAMNNFRVFSQFIYVFLLLLPPIGTSLSAIFMDICDSIDFWVSFWFCCYLQEFTCLNVFSFCDLLYNFIAGLQGKFFTKCFVLGCSDADHNFSFRCFFSSA